MALTTEQLSQAIDAYLPEIRASMDGLPRKSVAIETAFRMLSKAKPRTRSFESGDNPAPAPAEWERDFSEIVSAEWPTLRDAQGFLEPFPRVGTADFEPTDDSVKIRVIGAPSSGTSKFRVTYTTRWTVDNLEEGDGTLPKTHEEPLKIAAAAQYAEMLAGFFEASASASVGGAQLLDAGAKADSYRSHASSLYVAFNNMLGLSGDEAFGVSTGS